MLDNLKEVIEEQLAQALTKANYLEIIQMAELYSNTSLITKCGHFVFEEFGDGDEINWEDMEKLPKVMTAIVKRAMKGKEDMKVFKKREDFATDKLYGDYVRQNVRKGSVVRMARMVDFLSGRFKVGDLATVDSVPGGNNVLKVTLAETGMQVSLFSDDVEILAPSEILASKK